MSRDSARSTLGRGSAHSLPWVTFALVGVCIAVFSFTQWSSRQAQATAEGELQAAIDYLMAHPYLEPGAILETRIDPTLLEQRRLLESQARMRRSAPPTPKRIQRREQNRLDELVESAYAGVADLPSQRWGFRASDFDPITLLTHFVLHESTMHLLCGLALVLLLGFQLETSWGSGPYAVFLPLAAISSAMVFGGGNREFEMPYVGLSGLVAAMLAAYLQSHRSAWKQPVYPFALVSGALFLILPIRFGNDWSLASGLELTRVLTLHHGASYWAIAGGFVFGSFWQFIASQLQAGARVDEADPGRHGQGTSPRLEQAIGAQAAGRTGEAFSAVSQLLAEAPDHHEALLLMWEVALERDDVERASAALIRAIRAEVKRADEVAAVEHWLDLVNRGRTDAAEPALLIRLALMLEQHNQRFAAVEALQLALDRSDGDNATVIATRVARASRDFDPELARAAAWRALASIDLEFEERRSLEGMLEAIGAGIESAAIGALTSETRRGEIELAPAREPHAAGANHEPPRPRPEAWVDPLLSEGGSSPCPAATRDGEAAPEGEILELTELVPAEPSWSLADEADASSPARQAAAPAPEPGADASSLELHIVSRTLRSVTAAPFELAHGGLRVEVAQGRKRRVQLSKVEAIAVAAVGGLGAKPVILIDLVMNWQAPTDGLLKVIRLRGDRFDARRLVTGADSPLDAFRALAGELLRVSGAIPLPDARSAVGLPFVSYASLEVYQSAVLNVDVD